MRRSPADNGHVDGQGTVVGDLVDGYEIVRRLRVRGCAAVYKAVKDGEFAALKTLCRGAAARSQSRMDNEQRALRSLAGCSRVPDLLGVGTSGPQRYVAMSWRPGASLRRLSVIGEGDPVGRFADLAVSVCEVYGELHRRGFAHGDISRHNVLIDVGGVSLVDFESSSGPHEPKSELLRRRFTWSYAAPEFACDTTKTGPIRQVPTAASDQYAVAAVLYRHLSGRYPRPSVDGVKPDSPQALDSKALPLDGPAVQRWPGLPNVFAMALNLDPRDRYPDMAAFATALDAALG